MSNKMNLVFRILLTLYFLQNILCSVNINVKLYMSKNPEKSFDISENTELDKLDGFCLSDDSNECNNYIITQGFLSGGE